MNSDSRVHIWLCISVARAIFRREGKMIQRERSRRKTAGFTILTALAFSIVVATVLAGVGTVSMSHFARADVEATYANAVSYADAGVNYELQRISSDITNASLVDQMSSPRTVQVNTLTGMSGMQGSFTV